MTIRAMCMACKAKGEYSDLSADACKQCGRVGWLAPLVAVPRPKGAK